MRTDSLGPCGTIVTVKQLPQTFDEWLLALDNSHEEKR